MKVIYKPENNSFIPSTIDSLLPQIMWHITEKCMLNCKMCFSKHIDFCNSKVDNQTILQNLAILSELQVQKIDISGGEPLLCPYLPFLAENALQKGFYLTITTRGLGLKENIEWLASNWKTFSRIIISIDSHDELSNDSYVGYKGAFNCLFDFIKNLKLLNCTNLRINTVVNCTLLNSSNFVEICNLVKLISPKEWCLIQPHPLNKMDSFNDYSITKEEFQLFAEQAKKSLEDYCKISILERTNDIYSTYWCLYPDNTIAHLSSGVDYSFICKLNTQNIKKIKQEIESNIQILP